MTSEGPGAFSVLENWWFYMKRQTWFVNFWRTVESYEEMFKLIFHPYLSKKKKSKHFPVHGFFALLAVLGLTIERFSLYIRFISKWPSRRSPLGIIHLVTCYIPRLSFWGYFSNILPPFLLHHLQQNSLLKKHMNCMKLCNTHPSVKHSHRLSKSLVCVIAQFSVYFKCFTWNLWTICLSVQFLPSYHS